MLFGAGKFDDLIGEMNLFSSVRLRTPGSLSLSFSFILLIKR
jgi:hypothetical protein